MTSFDPSRCSHVTQNIWRGNIPLDAAKSFVWAALKESLSIAPTDPLIVVSLIDNVEGSERDFWLAETAAFAIDTNKVWPQDDLTPPQFNQKSSPWKPGKLYGSKDQIMWWPIEGGDTSISLGPEKRSYNYINLIERLKDLNNLGGPVYIHCMNGIDRTGAVIAGIAMSILDYDLNSSIDLANNLESFGLMGSSYVDLVMAYATYIGK